MNIKEIVKGFFDNIRSVIGILIVVFSFSFLFLLLKRDVPVNNKDVLQTAAGLILGNLAAVAAYYFGSSKNESDKAKVDASVEQKVA